MFVLTGSLPVLEALVLAPVSAMVTVIAMAMGTGTGRARETARARVTEHRPRDAPRIG